MNLFYIILGATPKGRNTEQHDVFFGIAEKISDLVSPIKEFWKEAKGKIHLDAYQEVKYVEGFEVKIVPKNEISSNNQLYFINLGGYKKGFFQEFHEHQLMVGSSMSEVIKKAKKTEFYKTTGFKDAESHIDDKYGVDIDNIYRINDILPTMMKEKYSIVLEKSEAENQQNFSTVGYFALNKL